MKLYSSSNNILLAEKYVTDTFILNYLSKTRSISNIICGIIFISGIFAPEIIIWAVPSLILGVVPSNLEPDEICKSFEILLAITFDIIPLRTENLLIEFKKSN